MASNRTCSNCKHKHVCKYVLPDSERASNLLPFDSSTSFMKYLDAHDELVAKSCKEYELNTPGKAPFDSLNSYDKQPYYNKAYEALCCLHGHSPLCDTKDVETIAVIAKAIYEGIQ